MIEDDYLYTKGGIKGFGAKLRKFFGSGRFWLRASAVIVVLCLIYYPVGMLMVQKIDDNPDFSGNYQGGSHAVATAIGLVLPLTICRISKPGLFMPCRDSRLSFQTRSGVRAVPARLTVISITLPVC
jgi:hypothetical protein